MIHGHGDDLYKSDIEVRANFSTNVWYDADSKPLCRFLESRWDCIFHYPEPNAGSFRKVVAEYHGLEPENVLAGNGATELFYMVAHAFAGNRTMIPVPSFTEYEDACRLYDHKLLFMPHDEVCRMPEDADLMFICNPNNPDGRVWTMKEIKALAESYPDMVLVVDESFIHFAPEAKSAITLLADYPHLLVIRSMTKCYAIPGLRLGYMVGDPRLIEFIGCYSQPWSVNALAIEAGKYLLQREKDDLPDAKILRHRQKDFAARIAEIAGFRPCVSSTSFFLVETDYDASSLKQYLLRQHGILIRDASNFRGLNRHYFRINTLTDEKNEMLIRALKHFVHSDF